MIGLLIIAIVVGLLIVGFVVGFILELNRKFGSDLHYCKHYVPKYMNDDNDQFYWDND